jgi:hypothetical protein
MVGSWHCWPESNLVLGLGEREWTSTRYVGEREQADESHERKDEDLGRRKSAWECIPLHEELLRRRVEVHEGGPVKIGNDLPGPRMKENPVEPLETVKFEREAVKAKQAATESEDTHPHRLSVCLSNHLEGHANSTGAFRRHL